MDNIDSPKRITWDAKTAANYLGISYGYLLQMAKQKQIPFIQVGRFRLFRKDSIDLWLQNQEAQSVQVEETNNTYGKLRRIKE